MAKASRWAPKSAASDIEASITGRVGRSVGTCTKMSLIMAAFSKGAETTSSQPAGARIDLNQALRTQFLSDTRQCRRRSPPKRKALGEFGGDKVGGCNY